MSFSWLRKRRSVPTPGSERAPPLARALSRDDDREIHREWSLRFEAAARLALADLADELGAVRQARDSQAQALHLAAMRDAIARVAREQQEPSVTRACELFDQLVGSATAPLRLRLEAAQLALDTLTFLVLADAVERQARAAAALAQLEQAAERALAA